jgi:cobaltochelatase CobS
VTEKIRCQLCNAQVHSIQIHLRDSHPEVTLEEYQSKYPDAPILSELAKSKLEEQRKQREGASPTTEMSAAPAPLHVVGGVVSKVTKPFHELFDLGSVAAALNAKGGPIPVEVLTPAHYITPADKDLVPAVDPNHVYDVELLKNLVMGIEMNVPVLAWGHAGTGKTTTLLQICARTQRPAIRIQHTINTEEAHVIGQWIVKKGETVFQYGPLALAMLHGWVYIADEYDFALPSVLAVYQPVLEGNALFIKDAPPEMRVVKPHPNFRFCATGNTNGSGDETGLYQGTQLQNAANYDRFGITVQVRYMKPELETLVVMNQAKTSRKDAEKLVDFANRVRETFDKGTISTTVSPRALIRAASIGMKRGSYLMGLNLAFINRLGKVDREAVVAVAQRIFGTGV